MKINIYNVKALDLFTVKCMHYVSVEPICVKWQIESDGYI